MHVCGTNKSLLVACVMLRSVNWTNMTGTLGDTLVRPLKRPFQWCKINPQLHHRRIAAEQFPRITWHQRSFLVEFRFSQYRFRTQTNLIILQLFSSQSLYMNILLFYWLNNLHIIHSLWSPQRSCHSFPRSINFMSSSVWLYIGPRILCDFSHNPLVSASTSSMCC